MASEKLVKELRTVSEDCTGTPIDNLISNPEWGKLNFDSARTDLERAFSIFNDLLILPIDILPEKVIQPIIQSSKPLQDTINSIKSFDITTGGDAVQNRNGIVNTLKAQVDDFYMKTQQWIPYLVYQKGDVQRNINELTSAVKDANRIVTTTRDEIKTKKGEIDEIIIAAREASASAGVAHFTADFSTEADNLKTSAKKWLIATGLFGIITLIAAIIFFFIALNPKDGYATVQLVTTKLIILGVFISATVWCGKIYKALMHQVTINKHRANSIKTFQAFTKAASDDATRDAVLTETTKSIFGPTSTGYLDKEIAGGGSDQLKIIEVVKQAPKVLQSESTK